MKERMTDPDALMNDIFGVDSDDEVDTPPQ